MSAEIPNSPRHYSGQQPEPALRFARYSGVGRVDVKYLGNAGIPKLARAERKLKLVVLVRLRLAFRNQ
jgi:hypothetical protein